MTQFELEEHRGYLADARKREVYLAALEEVVEPGDVVLDLGTGSGLLGFLACQAGAERVVAIDGGDVIALARAIAADNGYADRIEYRRVRSTELTLDRRADVIVCDQIGGLVHDAGVLTFFADAHARLLAEGGTLVPSGFTISLAPVTYPAARKSVDFWGSQPGGLDLRAVHSVAANTEWCLQVGDADLTRLADGGAIAAFASHHDGPIRGRATFAISEPGRFDGFVGWFVADMSPSVSLTNDPWSPDRFDRWCNFLPLERAVDVAPGDRIEVELDLRPRLGIVVWTTTVMTGDGRRTTTRQSSFDGLFLSEEGLRTLIRSAPSRRPVFADDAREVLALLESGASRAEIVERLTHRVGISFRSAQHLDRFVREVSAAVS